MSTNKVATKADLQEFYNRILPYLGGMPEMLANKFSKGDLYSTDEKMIGQWIDGKPLYQKTIVKNNFTIGNDTSFTHGITNVDKIFIKEGFLDDNGSFVMMPLLWSTSYDGVLIDATKIVFKGTGTWGAQLTRTVYLVIQYTKTTDSPISIGDDTDYSTDEKIVGTWTDGKPVYQKTLNLTTPSSTIDWVQLADVSSLNIDTFIYGYGFIKTANDFIIPVPSAWNSTSTINANFNFGYMTGTLWCCLLSSNGNWAGKPLTITIQYTKTTS